MNRIHPSEITPERTFIARRDFMLGASAFAAGLLVAGCSRTSLTPTSTPTTSTKETDYCAGALATKNTDELGDALTPCDDITHYNNFYEFSFEKEDVAYLARNLKTSPWSVAVGGLVNKPGTFGLDDLPRLFPSEERIYRLRCVEAWSMVIPWLGFPLSSLLKQVEPTSKAKYVRFEALHDPQQMPGQKFSDFVWPYIEGLSLDEAMHDLTILATGMYGNPLSPQNGAPIRLVVPWKYGFKSIKSVVKIDLVEQMPVSLWMAASPSEYGFYANVNPDAPHPRWSQASERRIGELARRKTLLFNGYAEEVARLYAGMDLRKFF